MTCGPNSEPSASGNVPVIETNRLVLRGHENRDFAGCAAMWADPQITRFIGGKTFSPAQTWSKMLCYRGLWSLLGFGYWAIEEKATARFIGELGFADFKRELQPALDGLPEFGWAIVPQAQRQGFASEATQAGVAWADRRLRDRPTTCIVNPGNAASLRIAHKAGYNEFMRTAYNNEPVIILRR